MATPSFLATGFAFTTLPGTTVDVQNIIDAVTTMLTSTLSATGTTVYPNGERWTNLGGGVLKSPVDNGNRFMQVTFIRNSATSLEFKVADPTGQILDGQIQIAVAGSVVNIFGGPGHLYIEANNAGTWESARAIMTDPTPEPLAASTVYVWCTTHRNNAGAALGNNESLDFWGGRFTGGTITSTTFANFTARCHMPAQDTTNTHLRTQAGSDIAAPCYIAVDNSTNTDNFLNAGKLYQCVIVDGNQVSGAVLQIPIDTGVLGQFQVTHIGPVGCAQFAVRKA